jgi:hypothetical protein
MDLNKLANNIQNNIQNNTLSLTESILPATSLDSIAASFGLAEHTFLSISGISADQIPDAPDTSITLNSGTVSVLGLTDISVDIIFSIVSNETQVFIKLTLPDAWSFEKSFNTLSFSPFNQLSLQKAYFIYTTQAQNDYIAWSDDPDKKVTLLTGFNFCSYVTFDHFSSILSLLGNANTSEWIFSGAFQPSKTAKLPIVHLDALLSNGDITVGIDPLTLSFSNLHVAATISAPQQAEDEEQQTKGAQAVGFSLVAESSLGLDINIQVPSASHALTVNATPLNNTPFTLEKITQLPAASDFASVIPDVLSSVFANVGLEYFSMVWQTDTKVVSYVELEVGTVSPWDVIPNVITLENLRLTLATFNPLTPQSLISVSTSATANILPRIFTGEFDFAIKIQKNTADKWAITFIQGQYIGNVTLGAIIGEIVGNTITVPASLNDIRFSDFGIAVDNTAHSYRLSGSAEAQVELLGQPFSATLHANVNYTDGANAKNSQVLAQGSLLIGEQNFRVNIDFSKDAKEKNIILTAFWETQNNEGIGLDSIASELGLTLPEIPPEFDLGLQHAGISYDYTSETLVLEATSINYGSILLIALKGDNDKWEINFGYNLAGTAIPSSFPIIVNALTDSQTTLVNTLQAALDSAQQSIESDEGNTPAKTDNTVIHLSDMASWMLEKFGGELPSQVPEVDLNKLAIAYVSSSKNFAFTGDTTTTVNIPFLSGDHADIHVSVNLENTINSTTGKHQLSGFMEGDFTIGSSVFTLQYTLAKTTHIFEASWASTSTSDLLGINTFIEAMGINEIPTIPEGVDLKLKKIYLQYQAEQETLQLSADSTTYGQVFLIVSKLPIGQPHPDDNIPEAGTGKWEFVFGWDYPDVNKLSQVPVIGKDFASANIFHLSSIGLIISSADIKQFTIPELPGLKQLTAGVPPNNTNQNPTKPVAQGDVIPLSEGIAFVAIMDLGASDQSGSMPALRTVVTETTLTVMVAINLEQKAFTISALLDGSVKIPTGGSSDLRLGNAGLSFIFNDGITFQIFGDLAMDFDHQTIDVQPRLSINPEEIEFSVDVDFENGWHKPMGIPGLTLDEVAFEMGINLLPAPGINLGLEGKSHIGSQPVKSDNFAFVLEIIEEIPDPLLLSFYLAEIDVSTAMQVFVPEVDSSLLPSFVNAINMTDVSFYWAESVVVMPDGTIAQPGLRFAGNVEILAFSAHAALAIDQVSGIAGEFETAPIHFHNILSVTGQGKGVYLNQKGGKTLPLTIEPDKDTKDITKVEVVPPGGPLFIFHTLQSPYLAMSIKVSFLNYLHEEVEALVKDDGAYFKLVYDIGDLAKAEFDFALSKTGFSAHSLFGLHLKANIGPIKILGIDFGTIHLDTGFDIELTVIANENTVEFKINGDFEFEGARLNFPEIKLSFAPKSLLDLPEIIIKQVANHADEIFKDLFDLAGQLIEAGVKEVEHLAEETGKEVAKLAGEAEKEAEKLVSGAAQAVEHTAEEAAQAVVAVEKQAEKILTDATKEVAKLGKEAVEEVEKISADIAHVAEAAEHEVEAIGHEIAQEAEEVGKAVSRLANEAIGEVKAIGAAAEKVADNIINAANQAASAVVNAAKTVAKAIEHEATALWNEAKKLADAIADAAKKAANALKHAGESVWHAISKY